MRTLVIQDYEHPMYPDSLRSVTMFSFSYEMADWDAIPQKLMKEIFELGFVGYDMTDTRHIEAMGAGHSSQEILLTLASGASEGIASVLVERLVTWWSSKFGKQGRASEMCKSVDSAKHFVSRYFCPEGELVALEVSISDSESRFMFQDLLKNRYMVETVGGSDWCVTAKKIGFGNLSRP